MDKIKIRISFYYVLPFIQLKTKSKLEIDGVFAVPKNNSFGNILPFIQPIAKSELEISALLNTASITKCLCSSSEPAPNDRDIVLNVN